MSAVLRFPTERARAGKGKKPIDYARVAVLEAELEALLKAWHERRTPQTKTAEFMEEHFPGVFDV